MSLDVIRMRTASPTMVQHANSNMNVDYQAFLRLLVAQLRNQDPTNPSDSGNMIAQLASFSNVEQSIQINEKLRQNLSENKIIQAAGLLGHEFESIDGSISGRVVAAVWSEQGLQIDLGDGTWREPNAGVIRVMR